MIRIRPNRSCVEESLFCRDKDSFHEKAMNNQTKNDVWKTEKEDSPVKPRRLHTNGFSLFIFTKEKKKKEKK